MVDANPCVRRAGDLFSVRRVCGTTREGLKKRVHARACGSLEFCQLGFIAIFRRKNLPHKTPQRA